MFTQGWLPLVVAYLLFGAHNLLREILRKLAKVKRSKHSRYDSRSSFILVIYQLLVLLSPIIALFNDTFDIPSTIRWVGVEVMIIGITIHVWTIRTLGKFYSGRLDISSDQILVTYGPYRLVRHPGYFAVLLIAVGFSIAVGNVLVLIAVVTAFALSHLYRIHAEEIMLQKNFGKMYDRYKESTKKLIPFIYSL